MATAALTNSKIRELAQAHGNQTTSYWNDEASTNGVWVGILASAFPGSEDFVLQPEGQGEVSKKRNDILVRKITNFTTGDQDTYLVFEGKSSKSGDSLDKAAGQLLQFVTSSPKLSTTKRVWGIVARGPQYRLAFFLDGKAKSLKISAAGRPSDGSVDYYLGESIDKPGCVESVKAFLDYAKTNKGTFHP